MTVYSKSSMIHDNTGSGWSAANDYGPLNIGAGYKITKLQLRGMQAFAGIGSVTDANNLTDNIAFGIQYGPTGYEPYAIGSGSDFDDETWFYGSMMPFEAIAGWAPSSDSAALLSGNRIDVTVRPQLIVPSGGWDVYVTFGPSYTPVVQNFFIFASHRIWYHG